MKTIYTTLPIYDKVAKQCFERGSQGITAPSPVPVICPLHRLPSFQWLDNGDGAASVTKVELIDTVGSAIDITAKFTLPTMIYYTATLTDGYFTYNGDTLLSNLTEGIYYLKITMDTADIYYSDWIHPTCVFGSDTGNPPTSTYSTKYLIINFSNSCSIGNIFYPTSFTQTIWFESDTLENSYPLEEKGVENGEGRFIRTFARQMKKYNTKTKAMPDFMVDIFNRLKLHDTIALTDLVGDTNTIFNLEVEHEWLGDDKYYAKIELTFDYDESVVIGGCCG
jgi:hypothetical protein